MYRHFYILVLIITFLSNNFAFGQNSDKMAQPPKGQAKKGSMLDFPIDYKAEDSIIVYIRDKKEILIGKASVKYQNIELTAEYIEIDFDKNEVFATGRVDSTGQMSGFPIFKEGKDEFEARTIKYNFNTKKGLIQDVVTEQDGGFLHSQTTKKHNNNVIDLKGGKYTTCNHEHPHFYIAMTKARIIENEKIVSGPLYLVIEDIPTPIFIPFGYFPFTKEQTSGLVIPGFGDSRERGFYLTNAGYYWAGTDYFDLKLTGSIYSKGSWDVKMFSNYNVRYKFKGQISAQYEKIVLGEAGLSDENIRSAYALVWNHNQDPKAHPNRRFGANVNLRSTSSNIYSTNLNNYIQSTITSDISYQQTFAGTPFSLNMNAKHSVNTLDTMVSLTLPTATFNMRKQTPFTRKERVGKQKWYETVGVNYSTNVQNVAKMHERDFLTSRMSDKFRYGVKHNASSSASIKLLKHINISPQATYTERWYFDRLQKSVIPGTSGGDLLTDPIIRDTVVTDTTKGFYRVWDYSTSVNMSTKIYGMYKFSPALPVEAIRIVHDPAISLSYRPDFGDPSYGYYATDSLAALNYNRYLSGVYGTPSIGRSQSITFSLNNNIEMKVRTPKDTANSTKKITLFDNLGLRSSYNAVADSMNWSALTFNARTRFLNFLNFDFSGSMDWYAIDEISQTRVNRFEYDKSGKLGRLTSARFTANFNLNANTFTGKNTNTLPALNPMDYNYYYNYFDIPWSLNVSYSYDYSKAVLTKRVVQTINLDGDFSITNKWKINYSTGYDLEKKQISITNFGITRDLHCWVMSFDWVPFGDHQSYYFTIRVKSSILQDLKYDKREHYYDAIQRF